AAPSVAGTCAIASSGCRQRRQVAAASAAAMKVISALTKASDGRSRASARMTAAGSCEGVVKARMSGSPSVGQRVLELAGSTAGRTRRPRCRGDRPVLGGQVQLARLLRVVEAVHSEAELVLFAIGIKANHAQRIA